MSQSRSSTRKSYSSQSQKFELDHVAPNAQRSHHVVTRRQLLFTEAITYTASDKVSIGKIGRGKVRQSAFAGCCGGLDLALFPVIFGVLAAAAAIILLLPWLRTVPNLHVLPALPWQAGAAAFITLTVLVSMYAWEGKPYHAPPPSAAVTSTTPATGSAEVPAETWNNIASSLGAGPKTVGTGKGASAEPMTAAVASLQQRLAKGGGSADDWELLAKSYEFLGRPAEAAKARAHQLPPLPADDTRAAGDSSAAAAPARPSQSSPAAVVSGEVSLSSSLQAKAPAGATLFIVAKAVDSPGPPVAVYRTSVGNWPVRFDLTDAQSMLPGRTISGAGRVTVEARISQSGQPLPAAGDLQGSSGVVNPAERKRLAIVIDKEVR
jgi:hypothetical protein